MIWIIVGTVIGIIYAHCVDYGHYIDDGLIGFCMGMVLNLFLGGLIGLYLPKQTIIKEIEIIALTDNNSIEGQKYLFSGYINEKYIYRYVIETECGKQVKELDNSENVYIQYDNENPRIAYEYSDFKYGWLWLFGVDLTEPKKIIYVPEGTITETYEIDLES